MSGAGEAGGGRGRPPPSGPDSGGAAPAPGHDPADEPAEDTTPPGPFPSWGALYALVIYWAAFLVLFLWAAGRLLTP